MNEPTAHIWTGDDLTDDELSAITQLLRERRQFDLAQYELAQNPSQTIQVNEETFSRFDQAESWTNDPETGAATIQNAAGETITVPEGRWAVETSTGSIQAFFQRR